MRYNEIWAAGMERLRSVGMAGFLDLGAETGSQNRLNTEYMDGMTFEMRLLGSQPATTNTSLFGVELATPVIASAVCTSRVLERLGPWDKHYLELIAEGLADAGSMMSTGDVKKDLLARIVDTGAPVMHIVKPFVDDDLILDQLQNAEEVGCVAVGMDIDCFYGEKARDEVPGPDYLTYKSLEQMRGFIESTALPFVVKGVLSVDDALAARDLGAAGIVVSNHGGEAIDYTVPILQVLPDIRAAVPDLVVLTDSGFRRGADVLKALASGADGVGIVTVLLVACAAAGRDGVRMMLENIHEELQRTMSFTGCASVKDVTSAVFYGGGE